MQPLAVPFQQSLCALPFGFALYDAGLRYAYVNAAMAAINGHSIEAHAGRQVEDVLPQPLAGIVRERLEAVRASRAPTVGLVLSGVAGPEHGLRMWGCDYFPIWTDASAEAGPPNYVAALVRDVTSEQEMRDRLDLLGSVAQQSADALYVTRPDQEFRFVFVNKATERHYGIPAAKLLTLRPIDLNPEWTLADLEASWRHMTTIGPLSFETIHRTAERGEVPVRIQSQALWHGGVGYVAGSIRSLEAERAAERERTEMREQLAHAQRLDSIGLLASGVAHDFNNLLAVILGHVDLWIADSGSEESREAAVTIRDATLRAADLTRQLLTFSRNEAGPRRAIALNKGVEQALRLVRGALHEGIELQTVLSEALPTVRASASELTQVVMNLVVNARDAMPDGGLLRVETALESAPDGSPQVLLRVSDTGSGMDETTRRRVFEPFFTTKTPGRGTGLGLSVVYGIIKGLGGSVEVESVPGKGTAFVVRLPAGPAEEQLAAAAVGDGPLGHGELVLVVDDEEKLRDAIAQMLVRSGFRAIAVASGTEALARLALGGEEVALLLTDLRMPRMSGDQLAAMARRLRPALPVVFMSGLAEDAEVRDTRLRGEVVLAKPFGPAELSTALLRVLQ